MPAPPSSPITTALGHLAHLDAGDLTARLARIPDPRAPQGRRHPLTYLLAPAAAATTAGATSITAIAEWAADAPPAIRARCGAALIDPHRPYPAPSEATVRRVLTRLDADALDAAACTPPTRNKTGRIHLAVDGKRLRGSRTPILDGVHLLAALAPGGPVAAQRQVPDKRGETTAFAPPLDTLDIRDAVTPPAPSTSSTITPATRTPAAPTT
ncbi:transposase family protein [Streptomyces sp. NPDC059680]|uniref:transposase family protein n=1 Tax=Streptomyces sp. NPDC059680 TaxID=3346904 RepID=UPI00367997A5